MDRRVPVVSEVVREYVRAHPVVEQALREGIVNLSALARQIADAHDIAREDAVVTALRRWRDEAPPPDGDDAVKAAVRDGRLEVRSHVALATYPASWALLRRLADHLEAASEDPRVHVFHGWQTVRIVADDDVLETLVARIGEKPQDREADLVELNLHSADASVPGFLAALTTALAARGIDIVDAVSCRDDHIFMLRAPDLAAAIDAIEALRQ